MKILQPVINKTAWNYICKYNEYAIYYFFNRDVVTNSLNGIIRILNEETKEKTRR